MQVEATELPGLFVVVPRIFKDDRGYFMESWNKDVFAEHGLDRPWIQDNHARSESPGVLRGLHFQLPPSAQTKLVRVTAGAAYDVVVDLRKDSPTYGRWHGEELSAQNFKQLFVPAGFAHGYLTLAKGTEFQYKVDVPYDPSRDSGIFYADPDLDIRWPGDGQILSAKDKDLPRFKDFDSPFVYQA